MHQPPPCRIGFLPHLGVLTVGGPDRLAFLQGQATCDFRDRNEAQAWSGAFCNAKGRVIANFLACARDDDFRLILSRDLLEDLRAHLQRYVLRARVTLKTSQDGYSLLGATWRDSPGRHRDMRHESLEFPSPALALRRAGGRVFIRMWGDTPRCLILSSPSDMPELIAEYQSAGCALQEQANCWRKDDILAGWLWICAATRERFIPQTLGLDQIGAVSFNKGCYTGQEIVARTHYLGAAKRGIRQISGTGSTPPAPGEERPPAGVIVNAAPTAGGWVALAVNTDVETTFLGQKQILCL